MEQKPSKMSRIAIMLITIVALLVPFCFYYVFYVSSQRAYFVNRCHRSLLSMSKQVTSRIEGLRALVANPTCSNAEQGIADTAANLAQPDSQPSDPCARCSFANYFAKSELFNKIEF